MEIVTEPDFRSKEDVIGYLEEVQKLMRWCGASDADMEKWQLRCDVNISIRRHGEDIFNNRVELKNINSFSSIGRAIDVEFARQVKIYNEWGTVDQETRGWSDEKWFSFPLRSKEDAMDYRYFPEPDLPPLLLERSFIDERKLEELPIDRRVKYHDVFHLSEDDSRILSSDRVTSDFFETLVEITKDPKKSCSYITTVLFGMFLADPHRGSIATLPFTADAFARVIELVNQDELSSTNSKAVIEEMFISEESPDMIVDRLDVRQKNDTALLEKVVETVIQNNSLQVAEYRAWKTALFGFFVGQCMKASAWQGNPKIFTEILTRRLAE